MDEAEFAWDEPNKPKTITINFKLFDKIHSVEVSLEQMNKIYNLDDTNIVVQTLLSGPTRKVLIEK